MSVVDLLFDVICPRCTVGPRLRETILSDISQHLQEIYPDTRVLTLVCPKCKGDFQFGFPLPLGQALGSLPVEAETPNPSVWFSILAECDERNCESPTLLYAIRPIETTTAQMREELPSWRLNTRTCKRGHALAGLSLLSDSPYDAG